MSGTRPTDGPRAEPTLDELLSALADGTRRRVIRYFHHTDAGAATVEEIAAHLAARDAEDDRDLLERRLHHVALPKLAAVGVLEYDARSRTAQYRGGDLPGPIRRLLADVRAVVAA